MSYCNKKFYFFSLILTSIFCLQLIYTPIFAATMPFKIVVDPGHGGNDHGAQKRGVKESEITLSVSKKLVKLLNKNKSLKAKLTRSTNRLVGLDTRVKRAHKSEAQLFISIHVNSNRDSGIHGPEFYFQSQLSPSKESLYIASIENKEFSKKLRIHNWEENSWPEIKAAKGDLKNILYDMQRLHHIQESAQFAEVLYSQWSTDRRRKTVSLRQAPFYVISNANMPAILIELGYLTNPPERKRLSSNHYQNKLAKNIYLGITKFKEILDKSSLQ